MAVVPTAPIGSPSSNLILRLRRRIKDTGANPVKVFQLKYRGNSGTVTIDGNTLTTSVSDSNHDLSFDLTSTSYDTLGKLVEAISDNGNYDVTPDKRLDRDHLSVDLREMYAEKIALQPLQILTEHVFDDDELTTYLNDALVTHDDELMWDSLPMVEEPPILILAQIECYYVLASEAAKFFAINLEDVSLDKSQREENYLNLIRELRETYSEITGGRIIEGTFLRKSNITGRMIPYARHVPAQAGLHTISVYTDTTAKLKWTTSKDDFFYSYNVLYAKRTFDLRPPAKESDNYVFTVTATDAVATAITLSITDSNLTTTVTGGTINDLSIDFSTVTTVEAVLTAINAEAGYTATLNTGATDSRPSTDLEYVTDQSILDTTYQVIYWRSHLFSAISDRGITETTVTGLEANTKYYFRIMTYGTNSSDGNNLFALSNEVSVTTRA